jgi:uroporphyrin-III C-methyltransferase
MTQVEQDTQPVASEATLSSVNVARSQTSVLVQIALVCSVLALLIVSWQWLNTRKTLRQTEQSLTQRLEQFNLNTQQTLALAKNADERSSEIAARAALLDQKLAESIDQQQALQALYLALANNLEERVLSEVEQLMMIASQQLQLAANVKPALLALQNADARLQQLDSIQALQLRKALAQDIQRLQNVPLVDVPGISLKLEGLTDNIDGLPLVSDRHPAQKLVVVNNADNSAWHRFAQEFWQDVKGMIRLERIDRKEPPLLAPEQTFFLRENIKLHLLTARIALLQHDEATYKNDLKAAQDWLAGHFDLRESSTQSALQLLQSLAADDIVVQLPDISESLSQLARYKLSLEHSRDKSEAKPVTQKQGK